MCGKGVGGWGTDAPGIFSQRIEPRCNLFCVIALFDIDRNFLFVSVRRVEEMRFAHTLSFAPGVWGFLHISSPTSQAGMENKLSGFF